VLDYIQLVEQRRPFPGWIRIHSFTAKKDGHSDFKKKGCFNASSKNKKELGPIRITVCAQVAVRSNDGQHDVCQTQSLLCHKQLQQVGNLCCRQVQCLRPAQKGEQQER